MRDVGVDTLMREGHMLLLAAISTGNSDVGRFIANMPGDVRVHELSVGRGEDRIVFSVWEDWGKKVERMIRDWRSTSMKKRCRISGELIGGVVHYETRTILGKKRDLVTWWV